MNRCCRLALLTLFIAAAPAFAHTWNINGQKVDGDFVKESHADVGGKKVAVVVLAVGNDTRSYPARALNFADKNYVREQVDAQRKTAAQVDERTWTDIQGGTVQARLMDVDKAKVVLLVKGGTVRLPFDKFTAADRDYVRQEMTARGEGDKVPKKAPPPRQIVQATPAPGQPSGQPRPPSHKKPKTTKKPAPSSATPQNTPSPNPAQPPAVAAAKATQQPAVVAATSQSPAATAAATQPRAVAEAAPPSEVKQEEPAPTAITTSNSRCGTKSFAGAYSGHSPAAPCKYRVCSHCGFKLPVTCKAGDECPNCGTYFAYEQMDETRLTAPATLRSMGAPAGIVSLLGVVAVTIFRARWYLLRG